MIARSECLRIHLGQLHSLQSEDLLIRWSPERIQDLLKSKNFNRVFHQYQARPAHPYKSANCVPIWLPTSVAHFSIVSVDGE